MQDQKGDDHRDCSLENQVYPGLHQKNPDQQVEQSDSLPQFCSAKTTRGVLCSPLGPPT